MSFEYSRKIHFYETDLMGIVHHSNYIRIFEETRVAWLNHKKVLDWPLWKAANMAVLGTAIQHKGSVKFNDEISVKMQVKRDGVRIWFQYAIYSKEKLVATGHSEHALLNNDLKVLKMPAELIKLMEGETWTETWP